MLDHHNYDISDNGSHTKIVADPGQILEVENIAGKTTSPILFKGVGWVDFWLFCQIFNSLYCKFSSNLYPWLTIFDAKLHQVVFFIFHALFSMFCVFSMALDAENPLILPIVRGAPTSYSYFPDDKIKHFPLGVGSNTVLVAGLQVSNYCIHVTCSTLEMNILKCAN